MLYLLSTFFVEDYLQSLLPEIGEVPSDVSKLLILINEK